MELRSRPRTPLRATLELAPDLIHPTDGPILAVHSVPPAADEPAFAHVHSIAATRRRRPGRPQQLLTGGSALDWERAYAKAIGEAVERHAVLDWTPQVCMASARELGIEVAPYDLFHPSQRAAPGFSFARLRDDSQITWIAAHSLTRSCDTWVPAALVDLYHVPLVPADRFDLCPVSGYACGNTLEEALLGALCEVAERDAFMLCWNQQLPVPSLDLASFDSARLRDALSRFAHLPVRLYCADLTTDVGIPVVLVMMVSAHPEWPAAAVATAADPSPERAVLKAFSELSSGRAMVRLQCASGRRLPRSANEIHSPEDHALYYAAPESLRHLDLLLRPRRTARAAPVTGRRAGADIRADLDDCVQGLAACGLEAIAVEIGSPAIAARGLRVVKVVVPGMLPIDFGCRVRHLGGSRLYDAPLRMGHARAAISPVGLNRAPHPFP